MPPLLNIIFYFILIALEIAFFASFSVYMIFLIYSHLKGSPYVPTKQRELEYILEECRLKNNLVFYDLGCGDGRIVRTAVKKYAVTGYGFDINPLLLMYGRLAIKFQKINNIYLIQKNIYDVDLSRADFIYVFLMPEFLKKLKEKFLTECKKTVVIVSHGFVIEGWENKYFKKIPHTPFPTYFYRI